MTVRTAPKFNSRFSKGVRGLVVILFLFLSAAGCHCMKDMRCNFGVNPGVHMGFDARHRFHPVPQPHVQLEVIPPNRYWHNPPTGRPAYPNIPMRPDNFPQQPNQ